MSLQVWRRPLLSAAAAVALSSILSSVSPVPAEAAAVVAQDSAIVIEVNKAKLVPLSSPASTVFVANPEIADVQAPNPRNVIVFGKKAGTTDLYAFSHGRTVKYAVTVTQPLGGMGDAMHEAAPDSTVDSTGTPKGVVVTGNVATPLEARRIKQVAGHFVGGEDDAIIAANAGDGTQVNLRVRVAEVSRNAEKEFGFNWNALYKNGKFAVGLLTGREPASSLGNFIRDSSSNGLDSLGIGYKNGPVDVSMLIDALQDEGLVSILAEPNLTATSGEPASFLAGGEFPVPVSGALAATSIEWKKFGVSVDFTPTVLSPSRISVKVSPEVSEPSDIGGITMTSGGTVSDGTTTGGSTITIPAVTVRRANTTVELASGQTFAIAGLFQNNASNDIRKFPGLGDIPILGSLFRSSSFQRHESELVILVTPYIVSPTSDPNALHLPTEGFAYASDFEQIVLGRLTARSSQSSNANSPHLNGAAGFVME